MSISDKTFIIFVVSVVSPRHKMSPCSQLVAVLVLLSALEISYQVTHHFRKDNKHSTFWTVSNNNNIERRELHLEWLGYVLFCKGINKVGQKTRSDRLVSTLSLVQRWCFRIVLVSCFVYVFVLWF